MGTPFHITLISKKNYEYVANMVAPDKNERALAF